MANRENDRDRFAGALLGVLVGDILGSPLEGADSERITQILQSIPFLPPAEREMARAIFGPITGLSVEPGSAHYTDDTQMMIGVAESLIAFPDFDGADMAARFADNFEPPRGYGPGAYALLQELRRGAPWDSVAGRLFGGRGSFGNGGAMRAAPVGVLYAGNPAELRRVAETQARITHAHILGYQGAVWQAAAVAVAFATAEEETVEAEAFLHTVLAITEPLEPELTEAADTLRRLLDSGESDPEMVGNILGNGVEAYLSVPTALYAFLAHPESFRDAVLFAVRCGGDTDTIAAMTGAIAGARHGADAIPPEWLLAAENGGAGRDYIRGLANQLWETSKRRP